MGKRESEGDQRMINISKSKREKEKVKRAHGQEISEDKNRKRESEREQWIINISNGLGRSGSTGSNL